MGQNGNGDITPEEQMFTVIAASAVLGMMFEVAESRLSDACRAEMTRAMGTVSSQDIFDTLQREHLLPAAMAKALVDRHILSKTPLMPPQLLRGGLLDAQVAGNEGMGVSCCDQRQLKTWPLNHPQPMGQSCFQPSQGHGTVC